MLKFLICALVMVGPLVIFINRASYVAYNKRQCDTIPNLFFTQNMAL